MSSYVMRMCNARSVGTRGEESAVGSPAGPGFLPRGTAESSLFSLFRPPDQSASGTPPAPTSNSTRQSTHTLGPALVLALGNACRV